MLLDTASLYFRAFYGVPDRSGPGETPRNAVTGLVDMMTTLVRTHRPSGLVACWDDDWRPAFRVEAIPSYKAHRVDEGSVHEGVPTGVAEEVPETLAVQVPVIVDLLAAIGIPRIGYPGYEADDVIGTLTTRASEAGRPVLVVTGDRDLFQLVDDDAGVRVLYTARGGIRGGDVVDEAFLQEHYGVPHGAAYADLALLRGDPSDGLPGVKGIGEKTAVRLLAEYGSVAALQEAVAAGDPPKGAVGRRLVDSGDYLDRARPVVLVARDIPVEGSIDGGVPERVADPAALAHLVETHRLTGVPRLLDALGIRL
ncbi:5'-3' exonuclease [Mobilicoccus pelagius]|uniref:5'-3' exonuclease n=1 Tax=Mobilicoccus pelagius NBRC 104925 TaxID=1089455 RepID=H5UTF1_9MICO|nr:5'-3' exonuclease [Mobilicoccus pelagius]GAB49009.1 putative 5'-3' exonuclease [Mobilicoccus pelagius NBRC 104925]